MAAISSPYGIQPVSDQGGPVPRPLRIPYGIANQYATNIFKGQPVQMVAASGTLQAVTSGTQSIYGIFEGVEYTPLGGRPAISPYWPGGTNFDPNFDMFVYIIPAWSDSLRFRVQADGSVAQAKIGRQFNISNATAGTTPLGLSQCTLGAAGVGAGVQGQFVLLEFYGDPLDPTNPPGGDAFTDCIVAVSNAQILGGLQTSIG